MQLNPKLHIPETTVEVPYPIKVIRLHGAWVSFPTLRQKQWTHSHRFWALPCKAVCNSDRKAPSSSFLVVLLSLCGNARLCSFEGHLMKLYVFNKNVQYARQQKLDYCGYNIHDRVAHAQLTVDHVRESDRLEVIPPPVPPPNTSLHYRQNKWILSQNLVPHFPERRRLAKPFATNWGRGHQHGSDPSPARPRFRPSAVTDIGPRGGGAPSLYHHKLDS